MASAGNRRAAGYRTIALQAVRTLVAALGQSARTVEANTGITNAQLFLLRQLAATDQLSINELAARAQTLQNSVSAVTGRLVRAGLVAKVRSRDDRRRAALSLTAKGRRLLRQAPSSPTEDLIAALNALALDDVRCLAEGLQALNQSLGLTDDVAPMLFEKDRGPLARDVRPR